jgi:hypothetical protein
MRFIKLALISLVVFYCLIWGITMLFPNVTLVSRAVNIAGSKDSISQKLGNNRIGYREWLTGSNQDVDIKTSDISFYENNLFNAEKQDNVDTIYFEILHHQKPFIQGGIGLYQLTPDSATAQLFYVFRTRWYKPWEKMAQIANDAKYGGQMDSAVSKLKYLAETR